MFRRMRQLALTLAALVSLVSLVLFVGTLAMWAWTYNDTRALACNVGGKGFGVVLRNGKAGFHAGQFILNAKIPQSGVGLHGGNQHDKISGGTGWIDDLTEPLPHRFMGFGYHVEPAPSWLFGQKWGMWPERGFVVPLWFVLVMCVPFPLLWWLTRRRLLRTAVAMCPVCNYDLRGTPGRCPECGWTQAGVPGVKG